MFSSLARFTTRYKIPIIIFWLVIAAVLVIFAPSLSKVGVTDDTQFLPKNTESTLAQKLLAEKFSGNEGGSSGSIVIVVYDPQGLSQNDNLAAKNLYDWLLSPSAPPGITGINSIFDNNALQSALISPDQTTMLINIKLAEASSSAAAKQAVESIRAHIQSQSSGPQMYVTGDAGISYDILTSIQQTIDRATLVTIILVIVLLLLIYRSPVAIFVPLITIGISYLVSRGIVGYIASSGMNVSSLVDAYLVVTLFGIGTDYCLFMVSRFKEELAQNDRQLAGQLALRRIGPVILASATTVIVALLCLGISRFGMNRTSGFMLAIGVAITLLAGLTLTPALISLFGTKLLWPGKIHLQNGRTNSFWDRLGVWITRHPVAFIIPIIVFLSLPYLAFHQINYSASMLDQMPQNIGSVKGYDLIESHFPPGEFDPLTLVIQSSNGSLLNPASLKSIDTIAQSLKSLNGISNITYFSAPGSQLLSLSQQSRSIGNLLSLSNINQLNFFQTVGQSIQALAIQYPGVTLSPNFQNVIFNLTQIKNDTSVPQNVLALLPQIKQSASAIADNLNSLSQEFNLQTDTPFTRWLKSVYFSTDGTLTRIVITLNSDPYSKESISAVSSIRQAAGNAIKNSTLSGAHYYVGGTSASQADILAVNDSDFMRVLGLAIVGILLVTAILLRSILAPVYMILTVLFNFGATLGIATWLFLDVLKQNTIIYMLPIFVFVILIAIGSDYNIFLVSRIREECQGKPLKDSVRNAVANTGGVITSCGIILAGTFGTLTSASLQMVFQIGAAIGIGVLIDTFLVRAVLIPSLASIAGRWNWWPSRRPG